MIAGVRACPTLIPDRSSPTTQPNPHFAEALPRTVGHVHRALHAQLPQPLTRHDRRLAELARRFPADRPLMLLAEDQGHIVGGALAFRTDPASPAGGVTLRIIGLAPAHRGKGLGRRLLKEVEAAAIRLGASEISLGASGTERGFYLRMGYAGRARLRKQLPLSSAAHPEWRRDLEELRQRRQRRLAARQP
jgi:GNAT superfamily N-acetyltransferase